VKKFTTTLLIALLSALAGFAGFNALIDPFGVTNAPTIPGLTTRETRLLEDGGRVNVGDRLARGGDRSILLGSSRTVDGFPSAPTGWPGDIHNAGMRGTNMFELGRAMALGARSTDLRCVVIGLDLDELGTHSKAKATYWLSALTDGNREFSMARVALSPNTFAASLQMVADNIGGDSPRTPWADTYEAGAQLARYESGARGIYGYYLGYRYDPDRLDYFERALAALTSQGIQVIGFIHPLHAWREEAMFRAGRADDYLALRSNLTTLFARYATQDPVDACGPGGAAVLWDFSGFQSPATRAAPQTDQTAAHPTFYEPSHYLPHVGQSMLDRMHSPDAATWNDMSAFGHRLTPDNLPASSAALLARREAWLATEDGDRATALLDSVIASNPDPELAMPQYLNRDDWRGLDDALGEIAPRATRRER
jgi:hypothetical protein